MTHKEDSLIGLTVLEHFEIQRRIGAGSFATAYLALQKPMERLAVIKVTHPHLVEGEGSAMIQQRFEAEIRAATRVNHPNLVTLYTTGTVRGLPAFAMEYISGISLEQWLQEHAPLNEELLRGVVLQLLSAIKALHQRDIIHRDLNPRNIMVTPLSAQGDVKLTLLDFGVAQLDGQINHTMGPLGTPRYMAPEQIQGHATTASDMYSFGAILWWMLTGKPYLESMNHFAEIFKYQLTHDCCTDPRLINPDIMEYDALWLQQLLHAQPLNRPTAAEYYQAWRQQRWPMSSSRELRTAIHSGEWNTGPLIAISGESALSAETSTPLLTRRPSTQPSIPAPSPQLITPHDERPDTTLDMSWLKQQQAQFPQQTQILIDRFIGEMPELLSQLHPESAMMARTLERMTRISRALGARNLHSLCAMYLALFENGLLDDHETLTHQLEQSYHSAFQALMKANRVLNTN